MVHQLSSIFTKLCPYLPRKGDRTPFTNVRLSGFFLTPSSLESSTGSFPPNPLDVNNASVLFSSVFLVKSVSKVLPLLARN